MSKTLVIVLSETRAHELTFDNFKKNVIDELQADLCICIGVKSDYDYDNPFYNLAKYKFLYNEPADYGDAFEYAYNILAKDLQPYEKIEHVNTLYGKIQHPKQSTDNITYYGNYDSITNFEQFDNDDEIIIHTNNFEKESWKNQVYGIKKSENNNLIIEQNVNTYKKPLYWREFLKISFHGWGVKGAVIENPASSGILLFFRWFLLKNLIENDLINKYDRFIITRSDFIYQLPHPKVELMNENCIWIPDCEHYEGYTDRHVVLSNKNIEQYLNIFNNMVSRSNEYFINMNKKINWNLEQLIKFHLEKNNVLHLVREFPYVMYSVRNINGSTRWASGTFNSELGYYIKYQTEYDKSTFYKNEFEKSGLTHEQFYKKYISVIFNGQAEQDRFVLTLLNYKKNGFFIELGSQHPINTNNTFFLEKLYGWRGIMIEYDEKYLPLYKLERVNSIHIIEDATKINYRKLFTDCNVPTVIDYLQIDLDVDNGSTLNTLIKLNDDILEYYKFATITFEHDIYASENESDIWSITRKKSREILKNRGYILMFPDVRLSANLSYRGKQCGAFEDWYVHPDLIDANLISKFKTDKSLVYYELYK